MKTLVKATLALSIMTSVLAFSAQDSFAWACQAQADDGTTGWSYNYPNRKQARRRAIAECNARTYDSCYIVACQPNG